MSDNNHTIYHVSITSPDGWKAEMSMSSSNDNILKARLEFWEEFDRLRPQVSHLMLEQQRLPLPDETKKDTLYLGGASVSSNSEIQIAQYDLVGFYLEKNPQNQYEQVLTIAYFYQKFKGLEYLTAEVYRSAYIELQKAAVKAPQNPLDAINNTLKNRSDFFRVIGKGQYIITVQGEKFIENLRTE